MRKVYSQLSIVHSLLMSFYRSVLLLTIVYGLSTVKTFAQTKYDFIVAQDGSGNFKTVQEAFNAVPDFRKNTTTIFIKNGIYKEKLILAGSKTNVYIIGEDVLKTILTYDDSALKTNKFGEEIGTTGSSSFFAFGDGFTAENISFENSAGPGTIVGQAVAVRVDGDMTSFINCRFLGFQDTLYPHGEKSRQYYKNCYIEGTVDYIFGWSTCVFDNCTIFTKKNGLYVTAASTLPETPYGFVFMNCKITGDANDASVYLGRPWRPFAKTVYINCTIDKLIKPEGWHNWNKPDAEKTSFYAEYKSTGIGANDNARVRWLHQLNDEEVKNYSIEKIFRDWKVK